MNAVPNFRQLFVSTGAIARLTGLAVVTSLGACAAMSNEPPIEMTYSNAPLTVAEVPEVDWDSAKTVHWLLADYVFSPDKPSFIAGTAYRLVIRNTGEGTHVVDAENFFNAVAVKSVEMSAFAGHTGDDHVDEALGPKGLDGVPSIPEINDGEVMASESADAASDPFADDAEGKKDEDTDDAANPFAAKPEDAEKREVEVEEAEDLPEEDKPAPADEPAAEDDTEPKTEMANNEDTKSSDSNDVAEDDDKNITEDVDNDIADEDDKDVADADDKDVADEDDKDVADDDAKDVVDEDDKDVTDEDDKDVAKKDDDDDAPEGTSQALDWKLMHVTEVSVEPGHETTIEFVAVRPGHYSLSSGDWLATIRGMFTIASIVAPEVETKTAAVSE